MYNENLKTKFVQDCIQSANTSNVCYRVFEAIEKYEREWDSDICTKSEDVLQPVVDELVGFRTRSKWQRLNILKKYVSWCISNKVPNACDGMLKINIIGLEKVKRQTISNPTHLEHYLNQICEPVDEKTTDNIYRCYYWLAYAGMREEDILNVRCEDVDFSKMIVKYNHTEVPIYREAVPAFKNCVELTQFVYKHPLYSNDKVVWKDRAPGDTVVRGIRAQASLKSMRVGLSRRSKEKREAGLTDLKLSYYRVWISGIFHRAYEKEQIGIEPDFSIIVSQQAEGKVYKLDSGRNTQEAKKRQLAHDYSEDYQRWKLAYGMGGDFKTYSKPQSHVCPQTPITWQEFKGLSESSQVAYMQHLIETYDVYYEDLAAMFGCSTWAVRNYCAQYGMADKFHKGRKILLRKREAFYKFAGLECSLIISPSNDYMNKPVKWDEFKHWPIADQIAYMQNLVDIYEPTLLDMVKMFECNVKTLRNFCADEKINLKIHKGKQLPKEKREAFYKFAGIEKS